MLGISRYILRQLLIGLVLTGLCLACMLWLTQSLRFIELIVNKGLSIAGFLQLTLMLMPNLLTYIVPISLFAVILFVYNKMTTDRELVVLRAIGLSQWALARPALGLAAAATVFGYVVTLVISPNSNNAFREYFWTVRNNLASIMIYEGAFNHVAPGLTLFVRNRNAEGHLTGVMLHDKRDEKKIVTTMAERGVLVAGSNGSRVLLENGNRQEVEPARGQMAMLYFDSYVVDIGMKNAARARRNIDARERSLDQLLNADASEFAPNQIRQFRVEAHHRLTAPLHNLGFALIALACLLTGTFNRRGQTGRVLTAIALMVAVQVGAFGGANLATKYGGLWWLLYVNALAPIVVGGFVLIGPTTRRFRPGRQPAAA